MVSLSSDKSLLDVCELIVDCEHKTAPTQPTGYPSVRTPNVGRGYLILDDVNRVSEETYLAWTRRATPRAGDLILAREAPAGNVAIVPENLKVCLGQRTVLIRPDRRQIVPQYLMYLLLGDSMQARLLSYGAGATVPHVNMSDIRALPLPSLPTLDVQRKIATILSAYDDLIEVNTRRIALLEELARGLYREWFVRFRFPGHEGVRLVESAVGVVPEGWEVVKTGDAIDVNPPTKIPADGMKPSVMMNGISTNTMLITEIGYRSVSSGSKFKNGDTLFARITPCLENGKTAFVQFLPTDDAVACGSTEFIVLRSRTLCPEFVYLLARSDAFRDNAIKSMTGASGRQRVQEACFDKFLFAHPDQKTMDTFASFVSPVFRMVQLLADKNANLRRTRDLLLPRLVTGEVAVHE